MAEVVEIIRIARCPTHGLHGQRDRCFVCRGPVEQVAFVPAGDGPFDPATEGILEGIGMYAWMRDGTYYVGSCGTTLRDARRAVLDERGYTGVPDPYYAKLRR